MDPKQQDVLRRAYDDAVIRVHKLREALAEQFRDRTDVIVGINGSYARREATSGSEVEIVFLGVSDVESATEAQRALNSRRPGLGLTPLAAGGIFDEPCSVSALRDNVGGMQDTNLTMARRMRFLLEGDWLFNRDGFERTRSEIIRAYVPDKLRPKHICRLLLNDVVRYWRTTCADYERNTGFGSTPEAVRLIKLRYSGMLLYFGGVLAVGETYDLKPEEKREKLSSLFAMPPMARIQHVLGRHAAKAVEMYADFIIALDSAEVRDQLEKPSPDGESSEAFQDLKKRAWDFRNELLGLLYVQYGYRHEVVSGLLI